MRSHEIGDIAGEHLTTLRDTATALGDQQRRVDVTPYRATDDERGERAKLTTSVGKSSWVTYTCDHPVRRRLGPASCSRVVR